MPQTKKENDSYEVKIPKLNLSKNYTPILMVLLIVAAFYIGTQYTKISYLEKGVKTADSPAPTGTEQQGGQPTASAFTEDDLKSWAKEIGLDEGKFTQCYDSKKFKSNIDEDVKAGGDLGVTGTPSIFVGDELVVGAQPFADFKKTIDQELEKGTNSSKADNQRLVIGNGALPIVVFSDFECPFCSRFYSDAYTQMKKEYEGKIKIVFRHFPLSSMHPMAEPAALAAECANEQGKFSEMHDKIFSSQVQ